MLPWHEVSPQPADPVATVETPVSVCPGCGVLLPEVTGATHRYLTSSPACWAAYGQLLAAQYGDPERMRFHQLVVDAYAVQHPGDCEGDSRSVQSVGIHLMTLCLFLEYGVDPALGTQLHRRMVERPVFHRLVPPASRGSLTCLNVPLTGPARVARAAAEAWAESAWQAWAAQHGVVRGWLAQAGRVSWGCA